MLNQSLDPIFHALAAPNRRVMLERLSRGPASVGEMAKPLAMSLPAVMQHLTVLTDAGLVTSQKVGRVRVCRLQPQALTQAQAWIDARRAEWESRLDRLGAYLQTLQDEEPPHE